MYNIYNTKYVLIDFLCVNEKDSSQQQFSFGGVRSHIQIFNCTSVGVLNPCIIQGSVVYVYK